MKSDDELKQAVLAEMAEIAALRDDDGEDDEPPELTLEEAVQSDLSGLPPAMRRGGVARVAIMAARVLDQGGLSPRDAAGFARELRLALAQLREMAPGEVKGDLTDEVKQRREQRLAGE